ncbi:hypothetical protein EVAR_19160_1 [Eumeta japonica]|uniref:Uncharacterized protein n=1 Tax=Eumeta variegata TaxID=151549 RepID=A0A4C1VNP2_EUMVA|nr:hypothetical protein EVAR_19160_1 [Eumeta japonica]
MAFYLGDMLRMFTEFSFCKSSPFAQFTGWDLVFLLEIGGVKRERDMARPTRAARARATAPASCGVRREDTA